MMITRDGTGSTSRACRPRWDSRSDSDRNRHMREMRDMRRVRVGILAVAAMVGIAQSASAAPANESVAPGWQAFFGCWEPLTPPPGTLPPGVLPDTAQAHLVCVVPVE